MTYFHESNFKSRAPLSRLFFHTWDKGTADTKRGVLSVYLQGTYSAELADRRDGKTTAVSEMSEVSLIEISCSDSAFGLMPSTFVRVIKSSAGGTADSGEARPYGLLFVKKARTSGSPS